jgi:hypothetical protein
MNQLNLIIDALENSEPNGTGWVHVHEQKHQEALAAARELKEANADMLSALRAIVAVAETEDSFSMKTIKDCANIAIKQARGKK